MTQKVNLSSVSLGVEGMTCGSCVQSIEQRIGTLPGVIHIKVNVQRCSVRTWIIMDYFSFIFFQVDMQFVYLSECLKNVLNEMTTMDVVQSNL